MQTCSNLPTKKLFCRDKWTLHKLHLISFPFFHCEWSECIFITYVINKGIPICSYINIDYFVQNVQHGLWFEKQ